MTQIFGHHRYDRRAYQYQKQTDGAAMESIVETIEQRDSQYGDYKLQSAVAQNIKVSMLGSENWEYMPNDMRESLDMIATKISRLLTGNFNSIDTWHDITGYATLIENRLVKEQQDKQQQEAEKKNE